MRYGTATIQNPATKPLLAVHRYCHQIETCLRRHSLYVPKDVARWLTSCLQDARGIIPIWRGRRIHRTRLLAPIGRRWLISRALRWRIRRVGLLSRRAMIGWGITWPVILLRPRGWALAIRASIARRHLSVRIPQISALCSAMLLMRYAR